MHKQYEDIPLIVDKGENIMYASWLINNTGNITDSIIHAMDLSFAINKSLTKAYIYSYNHYDHARVFFTEEDSLKYLMIRNSEKFNTFLFKLDEEGISYSDADKDGIVVHGSFHADIAGKIIEPNSFLSIQGGLTLFVTDNDVLLLRYIPSGIGEADIEINKNLNYEDIVASEYVSMDSIEKEERTHYILLRSRGVSRQRTTMQDKGFLIPLQDIQTNEGKIDYDKIKIQWNKYKIRSAKLF